MAHAFAAVVNPEDFLKVIEETTYSPTGVVVA
jgi:hypothetical protein